MSVQPALFVAGRMKRYGTFKETPESSISWSNLNFAIRMLYLFGRGK